MVRLNADVPKMMLFMLVKIRTKIIWTERNQDDRDCHQPLKDIPGGLPEPPDGVEPGLLVLGVVVQVEEVHGLFSLGQLVGLQEPLSPGPGTGG